MILIDMEMPDNCYCCILCRHTDMFCRRLGKMLDRDDCYDERPKNCPLHEATAELMSNKPRYTENEIKEMCDKYMSSVNGYLGGVKDIVEASKDMPIRLRRPTAIVDTNDLISRQAAIDAVDEALTRVFVEHRDVAEKVINKIPSAQPEVLACGEGELIAQPETHEKRTETHACDLIDRAAAQTELMMKCERYTLARESHGMGRVEWSSDLISVADAMDTIRDLPPAQPDLSEYSDKLWKKAYERGKAEAQQRWIPCSERLPAYGEDVLISIGGYCNVGYIVSVNEEEQYNWYFSGWYHLPNDVDAWMPLPEPYAERRTDEQTKL